MSFSSSSHFHSHVCCKVSSGSSDSRTKDDMKQELKEKQAELKRLQFDLDMERGHVKILKHDNDRLRRAAVELVPSHLHSLFLFMYDLATNSRTRRRIHF